MRILPTRFVFRTKAKGRSRAMIQGHGDAGKGNWAPARKTPRDAAKALTFQNHFCCSMRRQSCGHHMTMTARTGSVAEWFKALVLKTSVGGTPPWVRIPPLPPPFIILIIKNFLPLIAPLCDVWDMSGVLPVRCCNAAAIAAGNAPCHGLDFSAPWLWRAVLAWGLVSCRMEADDSRYNIQSIQLAALQDTATRQRARSNRLCLVMGAGKETATRSVALGIRASPCDANMLNVWRKNQVSLILRNRPTSRGIVIHV